MTALWTGTDPEDGREVSAVVYGDHLHLEDDDTSLVELTREDAASLGRVLTAWGES